MWGCVWVVDVPARTSNVFRIVFRVRYAGEYRMELCLVRLLEEKGSEQEGEELVKQDYVFNAKANNVLRARKHRALKRVRGEQGEEEEAGYEEGNVDEEMEEDGQGQQEAE